MKYSRINTLILLTLAVLSLHACVQREGVNVVTASAIHSGHAVSADGVKIHYDAVGSGPTTIIFVHGWSCDRSYWKEQYDAFSDNYAVLFLDLAGHGESGSARNEWSMAAFGADVAAVADKEGAQSVVLVGHSMGGPVVLEAARLLGDRVKAVIGVDTLKRPAPALSLEKSKSMWSRLAANYSSGTEKMVRSSMFMPNDDANIVEKVAVDMAAAPEQVALAAGIGMTSYDVLDGLRATAGVPLVLLNATITPTNFDAVTQVRGNARLKNIDDSGHFPMLTQPDEFNALLRSTLAEIM